MTSALKSMALKSSRTARYMNTNLSRAVLELSKAIDFKADVIHCNDWQTALIPVYIKTLYKDDPFFSETATVLTVHNLGYQGLFWHFDMHLTGLGWDLFTPEGIEFFGKINFLKGGLVFSDIITTVSKGYSREDINGKAICKSALQRLYSLPVKKETPLIAMISRLAGQKGFDLIEGAIDELMAMDLQVVFLGTGDRKYQELLEELGSRYPKKAGVKIGYDVALAHKIEAGADVFLMPSRYEPCGLNQLYSLKYGTIPVVRATGGLDDTIKNFNPRTENGNGFKFRDYSLYTLWKSLSKPVALYKDKRRWNRIMMNAMGEDFSWSHSAREYVELYRKVINKTEMIED